MLSARGRRVSRRCGDQTAEEGKNEQVKVFRQRAMLLVNKEQAYHEKLQHEHMTTAELIPDRVTSSRAAPFRGQYCSGGKHVVLLPSTSHYSSKGYEKRWRLHTSRGNYGSVALLK